MKRPLNQLAEIAQKAVQLGGKQVRNTRPQAITEKSDRDVFTDVDIRIERGIRDYLARATPEIGFVGEEEGTSGTAASDGHYWALDPIDGTSNFSHGIPLCAVQLALIESDEALVAAISLPFLDLNYWATKGGGAYANGVRMRASGTTDVARAIVSIGDYATGEGAAQKNEQRIRLTAALAERVERVRMFGSAAHDLAWVAEGRIDATLILSNNVLDIAGGVLIAREAGATVVDAAGRQHTFDSLETLAGSEELLRKLLPLVRERNI
ncbi:inositol monophosphatase family protein [Saccharothrix hoggarensis]|uniref:Inositol monophosphatase family protein n=1 Tax=Saccharothrix hoggarensis TaxID=913853 RepID=A0ABW3QIJ6_9PSEU